MSTLSPLQAANIADGVYQARQQMTWQEAMRSNNLGIRGLFEVTGDRVQAVSGGHIIASRSGFGYVARGVAGRQGEALVALRGTDTALDYLTDARFGLRVGAGGTLVHSGFNDAFASCVGALDQAVRSINPSHVHVVGHSLGGALATLAADHLRRSGRAVTLYTFGSPRVGCKGFAEEFVERIGPDSIFRTSHTGDPVAMVPVYPYLHLPPQGPEFSLQWPSSVDFSAHMMASYIKSVQEQSWGSILSLSIARDKLRRDIESLLETPPTSRLGMFSSSLLGMIRAALGFICEVVGYGVAFHLTAGATVLDHLAAMIRRSIDLDVKLTGYVTTLIAMIFRFLGRTMVAGAKLSVAFIRWTLDLLYSAVRVAASRSLVRLQYL